MCTRLYETLNAKWMKSENGINNQQTCAIIISSVVIVLTFLIIAHFRMVGCSGSVLCGFVYIMMNLIGNLTKTKISLRPLRSHS